MLIGLYSANYRCSPLATAKPIILLQLQPVSFTIEVLQIENKYTVFKCSSWGGLATLKLLVLLGFCREIVLAHTTVCTSDEGGLQLTVATKNFARSRAVR